MKKALCAALAVLMMLALAACSQTPAPPSSSGPAPSGDAPSGSEPAEAADDSLQRVLDAGVITVGTSPDFAPSEFLDLSQEGQAQFVGSDMELARYIAAELGVELEIKAMDFSTVTASVDQGVVDLGISGFTVTEERQANFTTSVPLKNDGYQGIMVLKANADQYTSLDDFNKAEVIIGAQNGSLQLKLVEEELPNAEVKLISTIAEGIMMLQSGNIDALGMSGVSGDGYVRNYDDLVMSDVHYDFTSPGTCVLMKKGSDSLKAAVDEIIEAVNSTDLYAGWRTAAQDLAFEIGEGL